MYSSLSTDDFKKDSIIVDAARLLNTGEFLNNRLTYIALRGLIGHMRGIHDE